MQVARRITLGDNGGGGIIMELKSASGGNSSNTTCTRTRTTTATATATATPNNAGAARDDYVRSAARFRSLLGSALVHVAEGFGKTRAAANNQNGGVRVRAEGGGGSPS